MCPSTVFLVAGLALCLACCVLTQSDGLNFNSELWLPGDYSIAGMFPLHNTEMPSTNVPGLTDCKEGKYNKHGYHLMQAMRFAVDEINKGTKNRNLLPNVTLGYQTYDTCSLSASTLATLDLLAQLYRQHGERQAQAGRAVAVVGPDSSSYSFAPAAALGYYLMPQISYEASNEVLSNKYLYPAFFRTIPSDKNQVSAMIQLLVKFKWTWIALLASDNDYGLQGMQSLSEQASDYEICIAYKAVIPTYSETTRRQIGQMIKSMLQTQVNTIVVFSSKRIVSGFFRVVIEQNVTGKVWIGTEDWSVATLVSGIPGINAIGTVFGISVKSATMPGFKEFQQLSIENAKQNSTDFKSLNDTWDQGLMCLQDSGKMSTAADFSLDKYDVTSSFNVYKAVYALAHALHLLLDCDSEKCKLKEIQSWQLLQRLKKVRFSIGNASMYFDENGDPPTGYDIVTWNWTGGMWNLQLIGSYSPNPATLEIDTSKINWNTNGPGMVPLSRCSPECPTGHRKILTGQHKCCFDCMACPAATFLNKSVDSTTCQPCQKDEWAPKESEACLKRKIVYLPWEDPVSLALLVLLALTVFLTFSTALIFLFQLNTPVVKSAGGRTCLVMLTTMAGAACSTLCHFGPPTHLACMFKQPLFILSFTVCLSCVAMRSFQVVCIFKLSSKLPRAYDKWVKNGGPQIVILVISGTEFLMSLLRIVLDPPYPTQNYDFYPDQIILECSKAMSLGSILELAYVALLCVLCFFFSYMGKDLPANYNEAKCITFSLMIIVISWISFFTVYFGNRGRYVIALQVVAQLASVMGILGGYFLPKVYIILLRPKLNTTAHFQNCIQMYTMSKD